MFNVIDCELSLIDGIIWVYLIGGFYVWLILLLLIDVSFEGVFFDCVIEEGVFYVFGYYCFFVEGL